jgi:hypothetical protein
MKRCDAQQASTPPAVVAPATPPAVEAKPAPVTPPVEKQASDTAATPKPDVAAQAPPAGNNSDEAKPDETAPQANSEPNSDDGGEAPATREGLKIGELLEQVLTRTPSGKCKFDLPWVKVQFDCGQE